MYQHTCPYCLQPVYTKYQRTTDFIIARLKNKGKPPEEGIETINLFWGRKRKGQKLSNYGKGYHSYFAHDYCVRLYEKGTYKRKRG